MKKLIGSKSRVLISISFLVAILIISDSCTKSTSADLYGNGGTTTKSSGGPGTNEVWIQGMAFNPATITAVAGTTIKWINKDAVNHTATSNTGVFDSGSLGTNSTYSHTFSSAGSFPYFCKVHPGMTATVVVN